MSYFETTEVRTELWFAWLEIAIDSERAADAARAAGRDSMARGGSTEGSVEREVKGVMTCVVAAAAALEAIRNELSELVPEPPRARSAATRVVETMGSLFPRALSDEEIEAVGWLFEQRNTTVHFRSAYRPLVRHPAYGSMTTDVGATYSLEVATRAVDVVLAILRACTKSDLGATGESRAWATRWQSLPDELEGSRPHRA